MRGATGVTMNVGELIEAKGSRVVTINPKVLIAHAIEVLHREGIGAIVACDGDGSIVGVISERDIVRGLATQSDDVRTLRVSEVMTKKVVTCRPDDSIKDVMATMTLRRVRHLPMVEDGKLVGIVSIGDVVKHRLEDMETETRILREQVIAGR